MVAFRASLLYETGSRVNAGGVEATTKELQVLGETPRTASYLSDSNIGSGGRGAFATGFAR